MNEFNTGGVIIYCASLGDRAYLCDFVLRMFAVAVTVAAAGGEGKDGLVGPARAKEAKRGLSACQELGDTGFVVLGRRLSTLQPHPVKDYVV